ncbi:MAG: TIGR03943 family putative permease subunit [Chloroflexota bacterium]
MTIAVARLHSSHLVLDRYLPSAVLAGYGVFVLSLLVRGDLTLYINPTYIWPTVAAAVALLVIAAARLYRAPSHTCCDEDDCACDGAGGRLWPYFMVAIPLFLAALLPPSSLAAFSALQRGPQVAGLTAIRGATAVKSVSLSVDTATFGLTDWAGALSADPNPKDYLGKPVKVTGMVLHAPGSVPPGYLMVMRYQITCCIADARPVGVIVTDTSHGALKDNQWVSVTGAMSETSYQGQKVAVVAPKTMTVVKAGNPYMY